MSTGVQVPPLVEFRPFKLLVDQEGGQGAIIPLRSVLKIRVEREEVPFYSIKFEPKLHRIMGSPCPSST